MAVRPFRGDCVDGRVLLEGSVEGTAVRGF